MKKIAKEYYFELAVFLMDYYSGQWSRGYRLLCRLNPQNFSSDFMREMRASECYMWLEDNYKDKV